jgi:hypothetical protein
MAAAVRSRWWRAEPLTLGAGRLDAMGWLVMLCLLLGVGRFLSATIPPGACGSLAESQQPLSALPRSL